MVHKERYDEDNQNRTIPEPEEADPIQAALAELKEVRQSLRERPKDSAESSELDPTVTGRPRNSHIPITISDDRSEDSDIKTRHLLAFQSRTQNSSGVSQLLAPPNSDPWSRLSPPTSPKLNSWSQLPPQAPRTRKPLPHVANATSQGNHATPLQSLSREHQKLHEQYLPEQYNAHEQQWRLERFAMELHQQNITIPQPDTPSIIYPQTRQPSNDGPKQFHYVQSGPKTTAQLRSPGYAQSLAPQPIGQVQEEQNLNTNQVSANLTHIHPQPLDILTEPSPDLNELLEHIKALQIKADALKLAQREQEPSQYRILYRLNQENSSEVFLDAPQWAFGQNRSKVLKSSLLLSNISAYLERHPAVAFIVYRTYDVKKLMSTPLDGEETDYGETSGVFPRVEHSAESISIISDNLKLCLTGFSKRASVFTEIAGSISRDEEVPAPYFFIYHSRSLINQYLEELPEHCRKRLGCLLGYIYSMYQDEYNEVDSLLKRKKIRLQYIKYLFRPGEIVVEQKDGDIRGFCMIFQQI